VPGAARLRIELRSADKRSVTTEIPITLLRQDAPRSGMVNDGAK
jgi:hypothetical protein